MRGFGELGARRRLHPAESERTVGALDIHPIQKQHVEVNIQVQRTTEALDQGDCAGLGGLTGKPGLLYQVGGDAAVDDAEHLTHDGWAAREQET